MGLCGLIYTIAVTGRLRRQSAYRPVFEDWLFHVLVPLLAYLTLVVSSFAVFLEASPALFLVGAAALLLLFTGIHNAWDIVTYHVFVRRREQRETEQQR